MSAEQKATLAIVIAGVLFILWLQWYFGRGPKAGGE